MKFSSALILGAAICGTAMPGSAFAQDAGASPATTQSPTTGTPPAAPEGGATTTISDAEVEQFATAAMALQKIEQDTATPATDKQTKMAAAVQQTGLTPEKFNEISAAASKDPALMQRIQAAAGKMQAASPAQ